MIVNPVNRWRCRLGCGLGYAQTSRNHVIRGGSDSRMRIGNFEGKEAFGVWTQMGSRKHVLDESAYWRNLANTIELSMCGDDAACLSNCADHVLIFCSV